ncbi:Large extracellular alpha-helical protein [Cupriavidus necator H850]|uniref:alpha-2-macroglobulin family protein n=1 Tax=Cupriavidus necator TaxID=106590 RepID=UPI00129ED81C|nr:MG2 domain-containing protein [Cupriavidus necator]KAI3598391.1 Large extracellular alpha-helical protein [Cupriavidus necator H850]
MKGIVARADRGLGRLPMQSHEWRAVLALVATLGILAAGGAQAAQVTRFSPEGTVGQVRQVAIRFDEAMVPMGDVQATAPAAVSCTGAGTGGQARWIDAKNWVYDFASDLPPGVRCTVRMSTGLRSVAGTAYAGRPEYRFETGGPTVVSSRPAGGEIEEDQVFALRFNGAATAASVREHAWCQAQGLGERIPVRLLAGKERDAVLDAIHWERIAKQAPDAVHLLACQQRLPAAARMQLVLGAGIATPSGVATRDERRFDYTVRDPFTASFSCEREHAQSPCTPLRPMSVTFSSPVPRKLAESVVLKTPSGPRAPQFDPNLAPDASVSALTFAAPFAEKAQFTIEVPRNLKDDSGRALANADLFPLKVATASMPPLAKFAAAPFGVVERFGELPRGKAPADYPPLLPVTLRNVEADLAVRGVQAGAGTVMKLRVDDDTAVMQWFGLVRRMHEASYTRAELDAVLAGRSPYRVNNPRNAVSIETRSVSLLERAPGVQKLAVPKPSGDAPRPFEVVGIPLPEPGFHVVEIASPMLGESLLGKRAPMYVRTAALVTNLGVHFKLGRSAGNEDDGSRSGLAWVTALDDGKPVADAAVAVRDCSGRLLGEGRTDASGVVRFARLAAAPEGACDQNGLSGYFVSARIGVGHPQARGKADMAFVMSDWNRGIETWRFNVPTDTSTAPTVRAHTIFDRTLLRAGETVSMKHLIRAETAQGFALPPASRPLPTRVVIRHEGSGQTYELPLQWRQTATGGRSAESTFQVPPAAKLGVYSVELQTQKGEGAQDNDGARSYTSGSFRVEAFRLPVLAGTLQVAGKAGPVVAPAELPVGVEIHYLSGGGAAGLPVRVSALLRDKYVSFPGYDEFSFNPPRAQRESASGDEEMDEGEQSDASADGQKLVADKLPVTLDKNGNGTVTLRKLPKTEAPRDLLLEAGFADPNGEIQTLRQTVPVWPAAVVAGIRTDGWVSVKQKLAVHGVVLDVNGNPVADAPVKINARARITTSARKRVVGGFYRYDNRSETRDLGTVCETRTDAQGRARCDVALEQAGQIELVASARDKDGRTAQAASTVWVTRQGELWFGGENHDRIDLLPEKKSYAPGETAVFQVRMPFRHATALVAVEREGIYQTQVVELHGSDPTVRVQVKPEWGPNVYVSVLALRGRLHEVPWYSFFTWGWRQPGEWWRAFRSEGREYAAPTALVDLSKPAFRLGLAEIRVGNAGHRLDVTVTPDKASYPVRGKARVAIQVKLPDGKPAANGEVALAAVDQALLELMPNTSWDLLDAMLQRRGYGVETSTAQMEIIGRRHYGRKAVPAGGGGGKSPTRELFDTLLVWNPRVQLDAEGRASIEVPLNDSLTSFRIVAVADLGLGRFGTGSATIAATQDLQVISGLPLLVREDDRYRAMFTLRNTTRRAMTVQASARGTLLDNETSLPVQTVQIPAGEAREIGWDVTAPALLAYSRSGTVTWEVQASEQGTGSAADRIKVSQQIVPAVPVTVQQATLAQVSPSLSVPIKAPPGALADPAGKVRGGLQVNFQSSLAGGMPGVREWFRNYPFTCLEQRASKAIGLNDTAAWDALMTQLPSYLDANGLASYFPLNADGDFGSEVLTAYLLAVTDEAARAGLALRIPDAQRTQMERGLTDFVEGRIRRDSWAPVAGTQYLEARKLAALEALSRTGHAQARMLGSIQILPAQWPTSALLDWALLLTRMQDIPQREQRLAEAQQLLRSRLTVQGTRLAFSTERNDNWWWMMAGGDTNAARLLALASELPGWKEDAPQLATGLLGRQVHGAWGTTTANAWGMLAVTRFSQAFEKTPVAGTTRASLSNAADASRSFDWARAQRTDGVAQGSVDLPWPTGADGGTLQVEHAGAGHPWATVRALAAVPVTAPLAAGYRIKRTVTPQEQAVKGKWSRGDVYRVKLEIDAQADMTWVVVSDPVPAGATILGSGLGRDSQIATRGEQRKGAAWPAYTERTPQAYREYFGYLPKGTVSVEYTVRLNNAGDFALPPTRVEAMYAPDVFGVAPNERLAVGARP